MSLFRSESQPSFALPYDDPSQLITIEEKLLNQPHFSDDAVISYGSLVEALTARLRGLAFDDAGDGARNGNDRHDNVDPQADPEDPLAWEMVTCRLCETAVRARELHDHSGFCLAISQYDLKIWATEDDLRQAVQPVETEYFRYAKAPVRLNLATARQFENEWALDDDLFSELRVIVNTTHESLGRAHSFSERAVSSLLLLLDGAEACLARLEARRAHPSCLAACRQVVACMRRRVMLVSSGITALNVLLPQGSDPGLLLRPRPRAAGGGVPGIEDFEFIKPISQGAFGQVLLARKRNQAEGGAVFAIKVVLKSSAAASERNQLTGEQKILARANNNFVVKLLYSFETTERFYFVMEYVSGGDTLSLLNKVGGAFDDEMAKRYIAETILAIEYVHSLGIIHRDLKPENIMIAGDGHIKLADFGLSSVHLPDVSGGGGGLGGAGGGEGTSSSPSLSSSLGGLSLGAGKDGVSQAGAPVRKAKVVGTPDYIAPEVLRGGTHTPALDYWAIGVILFEYMTGCPPFNDSTPQAVYNNILAHRIDWPEDGYLTPEAHDLIVRLLNPDPEARYGAKEVKAHPFFAGINWETLHETPPIWVPALKNIEDTSLFNPRGMEKVALGDMSQGKSLEAQIPIKDRLAMDSRHQPSSATGSPREFEFKNLNALQDQNDMLVADLRARASKKG
jgi:serine/threonine protein kinase